MPNRSGRPRTRWITALATGFIAILLLALCSAQEGQIPTAPALTGQLGLEEDPESNNTDTYSITTVSAAINGRSSNATSNQHPALENTSQIGGNGSYQEPLNSGIGFSDNSGDFNLSAFSGPNSSSPNETARLVTLSEGPEASTPIDGNQSSSWFNSSNQNQTSGLVAVPDGLKNSTRTEESQSLPELNAHVYVYNNDNDDLDVSLFIDSELKDTNDISSKSNTEIGVYPLKKGSHSFKISWWDEDVKKSFDVEETRDIENETSVNLYTIENEAPEKYEIAVDIANENEKDLKAYLYIDDSFEKSTSVSKESTSNMGEFELEEGVHELSVRWQDPDTRIEYEKTKKINVVCEDVVIFRAPVGVSFEARSGGDLVALEDTKTEETAKTIRPAAADETVKDTASDSTDGNKSEAASNDTTKDSEKVVSTQSVSSESSSSSSSRPASENQDSILPSTRSISAKSYSLPNDNNLYLYSAVVIFAIYLLFIRR